MGQTSSSGNSRALLTEAGRGNQAAVNQLWHSIYDDLRRAAHRELYRRRPGRPLCENNREKQ